MTSSTTVIPRAQESMQRLDGRIDAIDVLRGIVMVVMALDHTREYFHVDASAFDPTDPSRTSLILFATRWITYFCAPTFVLLSGLSAWLRRQRDGVRATARFLVTRGLWLIVTELTLVGIGFTFHPGYLFLQVIWVIGACLILLAALSPLPSWFVLVLGAVILLGHDLLDQVRGEDLGNLATAFAFLDGRFAMINAGPLKGVLLYSVLGWAGVAFVGYGLGPIFCEPIRRDRILIRLGLVAIALFLALRVANLYGDPFQWTPQDSPTQTAMAFMRVSKYPPSLDFALATLGPMLLLLPILARWQGKAMRVTRTYGRTPFFFYVLHIYLIHGLATVVGMAQGLSFSQFTDPLNPPSHFGFSLAVVFGIWLSIVIALYPACRWFENVRRRRRDWWLSYL
jgi:uncharacterized membrane protein